MKSKAVMFDDNLKNSFIEETETLLEEIDELIKSIIYHNKKNEKEIRNNFLKIFTHYHTVKSSAAFIDYNILSDILHVCETYLANILKFNLFEKKEEEIISNLKKDYELIFKIYTIYILEKEISKNLMQELKNRVSFYALKDLEGFPNSLIELPIETYQKRKNIKEIEVVELDIEINKEKNPLLKDEQLIKVLEKVFTMGELLSFKGKKKGDKNKSNIEEDKIIEVTKYQKIYVIIKTSLNQEEMKTYLSEKISELKVEEKEVDKLFLNSSQISLIKIREILLKIKKEKNEEVSNLASQALSLLNGKEDKKEENKIISSKDIENKMKEKFKNYKESFKTNLELKINVETFQIEERFLNYLLHILNHLIINAVIHGEQASQDRVKYKKEGYGYFKIDFKKEAGTYYLEVEDDGRGIDVKNIVVKVLEKELKTLEDLSLMTNEERLSLIFEPMISTSSTLTALSGRGVGLSAVKDIVELSLKGNISIKSEVNKYTKFKIIFKEEEK